MLPPLRWTVETTQIESEKLFNYSIVRRACFPREVESKSVPTGPVNNSSTKRIHQCRLRDLPIPLSHKSISRKAAKKGREGANQDRSLRLCVKLLPAIKIKNEVCFTRGALACL
jgi:hypothetical protein